MLTERIMGDSGLLKALALATQLGFAVACPMVVFIAGGVWADQKLGTGHWLFFLGLALGIMSAGAALYQIALGTGTSRRRSDQAAKTAPDKVEQNAAEVKAPGGDGKREGT